ncbi:unnamed protein product, partial [marine sediment metagenome]
IITFDSDHIPSAPDPIVVTYFGQYPLITLALDAAEQTARATIEGGTGFVENIIDEAYHESADSSGESAQAKITEYARNAQRFRYPTTRGGIRPGQLQTVNYPLLGLNDTKMLIESVIMTSHGNVAIYDITAIVGPVTGSWAKYFSTVLRRQTSSIHLGGEQLLVLLQEKEDLDLAEAHTDWQQAKGQYCWAPGGNALRELRWDFGTWG